MTYNVLYLLLTVGEPLNDEAWLWYNDIVGEKRCTVVDTWWQTGKIVYVVMVKSSNLYGVTVFLCKIPIITNFQTIAMAWYVIGSINFIN